jgi:hypothetical protein
MRARLAVFAAAVVVFAPGTGFKEGSSQQPASDIAVRMLAPAFDEPQVAAYHAAAVAKTAKPGHRDSHVLLALAALVAAFVFAHAQSSRVRLEGLRRHLRRILSALRDRGPPKLQLV